MRTQHKLDTSNTMPINYLKPNHRASLLCLTGRRVTKEEYPASCFKISYSFQYIRNVFNSSFLFISFILLNLVQAQNEGNVSKVGTTAAPFLEIEVGSRAIGMGGAFVAIANDATAIYWRLHWFIPIGWWALILIL